MGIRHDHTVEFDEFARTCDLVEEYFGRTIDHVALKAPVSRQQLVAVLARVQIAGKGSVAVGSIDRSAVEHHSNDESVLWTDEAFWTTIREEQHLTDDEIRAVREVHRRILESIGTYGSPDRKLDAIVLVERRFPTE